MYLPFSECLILLRPHKAPYLPEVGPGQTYFTVLCASPTALGPIDPSANAGSKTLLRCGSRSSGIHSSGVYEWPVILKKPKNCPVLSIKHREKLMNLAFHFVAFPLFSCLSCAQRIASPPPLFPVFWPKNQSCGCRGAGRWGTYQPVTDRLGPRFSNGSPPSSLPGMKPA